MTTNTTLYQDRERTLINIVRVLPPNRVEQLVDFARFLERRFLVRSSLGQRIWLQQTPMMPDGTHSWQLTKAKHC